MKYIYYTFLAGWCADAVGARVEFKNGPISEKQAVDAMHFVGEKSNGINEGQFTDDSEMEIALLSALLKGKKDPYFPIERIAKEYIQWFASDPFDLGQTTYFAISGATTADQMASNAYEYNEHSESNGALMRCIPIAAFSLHKPYETILTIAELDTSLTHYSPVVKATTGIYCCIISNILSNRVSGNPVNVGQLLREVERLCKCNDVVYGWYQEGIRMDHLDKYNSTIDEGHVKHAFIMAIYFLHHIDAYTYETAILEVLKLGGDTDTNAKIIGNLFGAYYGNCVPDYMSKPVLEFDCSTPDDIFFRRPLQYGVKYATQLVEELTQKYA